MRFGENENLVLIVNLQRRRGQFSWNLTHIIDIIVNHFDKFNKYLICWASEYEKAYIYKKKPSNKALTYYNYAFPGCLQLWQQTKKKAKKNEHKTKALIPHADEQFFS